MISTVIWLLITMNGRLEPIVTQQPNQAVCQQKADEGRSWKSMAYCVAMDYKTP